LTASGDERLLLIWRSSKTCYRPGMASRRLRRPPWYARRNPGRRCRDPSTTERSGRSLRASGVSARRLVPNADCDANDRPGSKSHLFLFSSQDVRLRVSAQSQAPGAPLLAGDARLGHREHLALGAGRGLAVDQRRPDAATAGPGRLVGALCGVRALSSRSAMLFANGGGIIGVVWVSEEAGGWGAGSPRVDIAWAQ
jgi:hypothetical protein